MRKKMHQKAQTGAVVFIILAGLWSGCSQHEIPAKQPENVIIQKVSQSTAQQMIAYSGTIEESNMTALSFSVVGSVSRVMVAEGDHVQKGQLLAILNDETYKNTYEMALASQKQAEDAYNRMLPMYKNGNLPEIKLVEVETALQQAKAATLIAKKNVDDCKLYSPVNGIIGKRAVEPGMTAVPNLTSLTIVEIAKVFARVSVSESEISSIQKGDRADIKVAALKNSGFTGTIDEIGVVADPIAHSYKIKIGINNNNHLLKPGMICNVTLAQPQETKGLFVPNNAVQVDEHGKNFVYIVNNNQAVRKYVEAGKLLSNGVEITAGLIEGDQIVVSGQQKLVDGLPVHIVN